MSDHDATAASAPSVESAPAIRPSSALIAAQPGRTRVAGSVVAKLAQAAATEVDGVMRAQVVGAPAPLYLKTAAAAAPAPTADLDEGREMRIHINASFAYPVPIEQTADKLRERVRARVVELVGQPVTHVDLTISELVPPGSVRHRRHLE